MRCSPEDLPEAMNYREKWRERVRDIRASGRHDDDDDDDDEVFKVSLKAEVPFKSSLSSGEATHY